MHTQFPGLQIQSASCLPMILTSSGFSVKKVIFTQLFNVHQKVHYISMSQQYNSIVSGKGHQSGLSWDKML